MDQEGLIELILRKGIETLSWSDAHEVPSPEELLLLADHTRPGRYRQRLKADRQLLIPSRPVMALSRFGADQLKRRLDGSWPSYMTGYRQGGSPTLNAYVHRKAIEALEVDIRNAFGSVTYDRVVAALTPEIMPRAEAEFLAGLACANDRLCLGNPMAPWLFLLVTKSLALKLRKLARRVGLIFTLYADNMAFSGKVLPEGLYEEIDAIVRSEGFELHGPRSPKTRFMGHRFGRSIRITGLLIKDQQLWLPLRERLQVFRAARRLGNNVVFQGDEDDPLRESAAAKLHYAIGIDRWVRKRLTDMTADPLFRRTFKRNLGRFARGILRRARSSSSVWEALA